MKPTDHAIAIVHTPSWRVQRLQSLIHRGSFGSQASQDPRQVSSQKESQELYLVLLPSRRQQIITPGRTAAWASILDREFGTVSTSNTTVSSPRSDSTVCSSNRAIIGYVGATDGERESLLECLSSDHSNGEVTQTGQYSRRSLNQRSKKRKFEIADEEIIRDPRELESWIWESYDALF